MKELSFEELEFQVQTLSFQIENLKKDRKTNKQSLKVLEEDYRHYKKLDDEALGNVEETVSLDKTFGDW